MRRQRPRPRYANSLAVCVCVCVDLAASPYVNLCVVVLIHRPHQAEPKAPADQKPAAGAGAKSEAKEAVAKPPTTAFAQMKLVSHDEDDDSDEKDASVRCGSALVLLLCGVCLYIQFLCVSCVCVA